MLDIAARVESILPGQAEIIEDLGEPLHRLVDGNHQWLYFSPDWHAVVGPDEYIPTDLKRRIKQAIPDIDTAFEVEWVTCEQALLTNFFRIL